MDSPHKRSGGNAGRKHAVSRRRIVRIAATTAVFLVVVVCFHGKIMGAFGYKNSREQALDVIVLTYRAHLAISDRVREDGTYEGRASDLRGKLGWYVA